MGLVGTGYATNLEKKIEDLEAELNMLRVEYSKERQKAAALQVVVNAVKRAVE